MTQAQFIDLLQQTLYVVMLVSAPVLLTSLLVGVLISIFQTVTQIQESTLTFVPKMIASVLVLALTAPWIVDKLVNHTTQLFGTVIELSRPHR